MTPLATLLGTLIRDSGLTKKQFGEEVGLSGSTISHILSGDPHYTLGVEYCLRIAKTTGASPSTVLRAARKSAIADLIEDLYGPAAERRQRFTGGRRLTVQDERHLQRFRQLNVKAQKAVAVLLEHVAAAGAKPGQVAVKR